MRLWGTHRFLAGNLFLAFGDKYLSYIKLVFEPAPHYCDLVAYFFRQCVDKLSVSGAFGLIATQSISQGDTKNGGLLPIRQRNGTIYAATTGQAWPGDAGVTIATVM